MKNSFLSFFLSAFLIFVLPVYSQIDSSPEQLSLQEKQDQLLASLSSLQRTLKRAKRKRPIARKIKLITQRIIRAVNSTPPAKCLTILDVAMDDFFELVSDLGGGISCGPPILPPFLPGDPSDLAINCLPPPEEPEEITRRLQIGGPFGGAFSDVYPVYNESRDLVQIDSTTNDIPDICE